MKIKSLVLMCVTLPLVVLSTVAKAGTINFYTDRALWVADATAAGLVVSTNDFSTEPAFYPQISVGGSEWLLNIRSSQSWDIANERVGYTNGGGRVLGLDYIGGAANVFGFGINMGPTVGLVGATDIDGVYLADSNFGSDGQFLGLLGTVVFDPLNQALNGAREIGTSGLGMNVHFDNLSVATANIPAVPVPAAAWLFGSSLIGLVAAGRRRSAQLS